MKKIIRIVLYTILFVLLVTGLALAVGIYNPRAYEGMLSKLVYKKTGYQYTTQDISIQLSPTKVSIRELELKNPEWSNDPKLLTLQNTEISVAIKKLLSKQKPFWSAILSGVEIQILENEQGDLNWNTSILANQAKPETQEPMDLKSLLGFEEINIDQAKLRQRKADVKEELDIISLLLKRQSDVSMQLQGKGVYKEQEVNIEGSVEIDDQNSAEQLLNFAMQATGLGINLQTDGSINPLNIDGAKISLNAKSDNLEKLEQFLEITFPTVTPIDVSLDLLSSKGNYELSKINIQMGENVLSGDVLLDINDSFVRANLASEKLDLSPFIDTEVEAQEQQSETVKQEETELNENEAEIDWAWMNSLNSELNLNISNIIINEHTLKNLSALIKLTDSSLEINPLKASYKLDDKDNPEHSFASNEFELSGILQPLAAKTLGEDLKLRIVLRDEDAKLELQGNANVNGIVGNAIKINIDAKKLDSVAQFLQTDFSPYLPAKIDADIETSNHALNLKLLSLQSKDSDIEGVTNINWSNEVVKIDGKLSSNFLDLSPIMQTAENTDEQKQKNENNATEDKEEKIFSDERIDWSWLDSFAINFDMGIAELVASDNVFNNVKVNVALGDGALTIKPFQALFADGSIQSVLQMDKVGDAVKLNTQLDAINLSLAALGAAGDSVLEGGTTDVVFNLNGQGQSLHQIMSSLNGEIVAEVQKATVKNDTFELIGTDFILELLSMLNPFMKEDETTELECAAAKFTAKDGVFTSHNQLAVETTKMKIVGGGVIDMSTEQLEVGFSPIAKKGFGVNVGSLVKFVRLGGTLSNPHPEADPVGLLKSGAAIGAALSTGGLSLLVDGLFKRVANAGSACNQALQDPKLEEGEVSNQDGVPKKEVEN